MHQNQTTDSKCGSVLEQTISKLMRGTKLEKEQRLLVKLGTRQLVTNDCGGLCAASSIYYITQDGLGLSKYLVKSIALVSISANGVMYMTFVR